MSTATRSSRTERGADRADAVVLYDEDCGFCRWTLGRLLAWDSHEALRPVPISSEEGERLLADMPREQRLASWHLVRGGRRWSAGAAFPPLLSLLPGGSRPARLSARMPRLSEAGYAFVARNRGFFGRLVSDGAKRRADRRIRLRSG